MAVSHVKSNTIADFTGTVTVFGSNGGTSTVAATDLVRPSDWNSAHNFTYTLGGNTTNANTASGTNVQYHASGEFTLAGSTGSIVFSGRKHVSSYQNLPLFANSVTHTLNGVSVSHAVAFDLPHPISASFLRIPVVFSTGSTTLSTAAATMNGSAQVNSTWNAVLYTLGVGANSQSLQSVAKAQGFYTYLNSISVAVNGTQYSVTQAYSFNVEGNTSATTTQYSISNTNYSFTTDAMLTRVSGSRWLDIPLAQSLSPGPYWLVFGYSSSTATNSARAAATACGVFYSHHYACSQIDLNFGIAGQTNSTSGGQFGCGSFSTAGGGTTDSIPISAISTFASQHKPFFQIRRSA